VVGGFTIATRDTHLIPPAADGRRDGPRPLHLRPVAVVLVVCGGLFGAAAREVLEQALPAAKHGFPAATFIINLSGAFVLGCLLEALVRSGDDVGWRRRARLAGGTGFCGAFTTYSTFAVESVQLARHGDWSIAVLYVISSLVGGLMLVALGIAVAAWHARRRAAARRPMGPDVDRKGGDGERR
jgi:CrcB protein